VLLQGVESQRDKASPKFMSKESNRVVRNSRLTLHADGKSDNVKIDTCVIQAGIIGQELRECCTVSVTFT
jgi:hypothetical protein